MQRALKNSFSLSLWNVSLPVAFMNTLVATRLISPLVGGSYAAGACDSVLRNCPTIAYAEAESINFQVDPFTILW